MLPAWKSILKNLEMSERLLPRDVTTRWNSTFEMLDFAFAHQKALDLMTQDQANGLREYELSGEDWIIVGQMRDGLKVGAESCQTGWSLI